MRWRRLKRRLAGLKPVAWGREGGSEGLLDYMNVKLAQIVV
ncbi:Uncharacterised protein [Raoultella planticola]|uniref:Uncharacterized protein n=1 Tax=Raoultella planticola TaxID=575 RepID=A0A485AV73_RAOPL|nr:Uncharacterised protein [Raoultella planticola]